MLALNYDSDATDQGTCEYLGCMDSLYFEYNPNATVSNGSCYTEIISGCLDSLANNYNPSANFYDGSCTFDSGINHISVTNPPDGFSYASGSDIIIDYEFISDTITIGYAFLDDNNDALIKYSLNDQATTNIDISSGLISLGELSNGV